MSANPANGEKLEESPCFTGLLNRLPLFFYRGDFGPERRLNEVTSGAMEMLGISIPVTKASPLELNLLVRESDRQMVWQAISSALAGGDTFQVEYRLRHARGHWLTVCERGRAVRDAQNLLVGLEGCVLDITQKAGEEKAAHLREFEAFQTNKYKAINVLASGVAHDFNNVIAGILGSAELVKMELEGLPNHPSQEFVQQIFIAGDRARDLIHQIKTFSQRQLADRHLVQLSPVVSEAAQLVRSVIPAKLEIVHDVAREFPAVLADASQVQQAIMNLCTHAWHSMPEGKGRIELKLALEEMSAEKAAERAQLRSGQYLCLTIADNGPGMSKSTQERVFEPFAHRRPNGKKSGLELFYVQEIMNAHQGAVYLESAQGVGTTYYLWFPVAN